MGCKLFDLSGKTAVITGAGGVLAGALTGYLAAEGVKIAALDLREDAIEPRAGVTPYKCNVLDEENLAQVYDSVMEKFGRVDILINGAGGNMPGATIAPDQTIFDLKSSDYSKVLDLNLKGTLLPTLTFAKAMKEQKYGMVKIY